jgi:transposase InsO family protein
LADGQVSIFAAIDNCTAECLEIHAVKRATRFEALEPLRQGVREQFGAFGPQAAAGVQIRHDHGSQYMSDDFQKELRFLGMESSPAFVREPECNGREERFFCTLKEVASLGAALPGPRRVAGRARRIPRSLQQPVADRKSQYSVSAAGSRASPYPWAYRMIMVNLLSKKSWAERAVQV